MMPFKKGDPKPPNSGRKRGKIPGKYKLADVEKMLAKEGCHPILEILKEIPELTPKERVDTYLQLMAYFQPKVRARIAPEKPSPESEIFDGSEFEDEDTEQLLSVISGNKPAK